MKAISINSIDLINPLKILSDENISEIKRKYDIEISNLEQFNNLIVSEENIKGVKNLKYEIKKCRDEIEINRKKITSNLDLAKKQLMEIEKNYDPPLNILESKIKEFEDMKREGKRIHLKEFCVSNFQSQYNLDYQEICSILNYPSFPYDDWIKNDTVFNIAKPAILEHLEILSKIYSEYRKLKSIILNENEIVLAQLDYLLEDFLIDYNSQRIILKIETIKLKELQSKVEKSKISTIEKKEVNVIDFSTGEILEEKQIFTEKIKIELIFSYSNQQEKLDKMNKFKEYVKNELNSEIKRI